MTANKVCVAAHSRLINGTWMCRQVSMLLNTRPLDVKDSSESSPAADHSGGYGIGIMKPTKRKKDLLEKQHQHLHLSQSVNLSLMSPHHQDLGGGSLSDGGHSSDNTDCEKKKKKARTTFTGRQIFELEKQFENKKYLSSSERSEMAKLLQVTETQGLRAHLKVIMVVCVSRMEVGE
ncbi:hypothetical protein RUM44_000727 [Polyplax serrata]|uniref:Homeobox domain-containing protein n=1 Tax=Polyplax serrata TaxID=468196 RepID=A0ABR1B8F9_POLSC